MLLVRRNIAILFYNQFNSLPARELALQHKYPSSSSCGKFRLTTEEVAVPIDFWVRLSQNLYCALDRCLRIQSGGDNNHVCECKVFHHEHFSREQHRVSRLLAVNSGYHKQFVIAKAWDGLLNETGYINTYLIFAMIRYSYSGVLPSQRAFIGSAVMKRFAASR
jgi:hypothetical protein